MKTKSPHHISAKDKKRYVFDEDRDYQILEKVYDLEKLALSVQDKEAVRLIRTQLRRDWRKPLLKFLERLEKKYKAFN